jgi:hypothetical protein
MKTLYFEGAGCVPCGEVANCRIRTAFTNNEGRKIYLELTGLEISGRSSNHLKIYKYAGFVDACHYITGGKDDENENSIFPKNGKVFEYTVQNILDFINSELHCRFDNIVVLPNLAGYRVFKEQHGEYNYGDEFVYNAELTAKRTMIYQYFYNIEKSEKKEYPNFSLWVDPDDKNKLHLLRHFNDYNKHWLIYINDKSWNAEETILGKCAC